ncbi:MAG: hypothetical protein EU549_02660 [Promethearchaeota archaeon]|nr:MAG: hypothetical protein EU549_02660 [Candidatus Lokiarchaeota archaeon]
MIIIDNNTLDDKLSIDLEAFDINKTKFKKKEKTKLVYSIVKDLFDKRQIFSFDEFYRICSKKLNLSDSELLDAFRELLDNDIIIEGSRLTRDEILANEARKNIFDFIIKNPGYYFTFIMNEVGLGPHACRWHLDMLERFNFIRSQKFDRYNVYFNQDFPESRDEMTFILRNENALRIFEILNSNPEIDTSTIGKGMDLHYTTIRYYLEKLKNSNLIEEIKENNKINYKVNEYNRLFLERYFEFNDITIEKEEVAEVIPTSPTQEKDIKVLRGGEVVGEKIIYKVKIQNDSKYNITDVTVFLISYPRECMGLTTRETRSVSKIESGGFRSLEFEFEPHKDCVTGTIHASATYIDQENNSHTTSVHPFTIRSVCDLLKPYRVDEEKFDNMILGWQKTGEFKKINLNIFELFERSKITLQRHNFFVISSKLYQNEESVLVRGMIKAFAEGKYVGKKIGMLIEMIGNKEGELSQIRTSSTSEDEGMMASPISEIIDDFEQAGLALDMMSDNEQELFIKEKSLQSLRFLLVVHKDVGVTIFSKNFSENALDADLISGFLTAISSFGMELSGGQSIGIKKMEYESLKIVLQQGTYVNVGLILDDFPEQWLDLRLKTFVKALETQYKENLKSWTGDVSPYRSIDNLFDKIFEI